MPLVALLQAVLCAGAAGTTTIPLSDGGEPLGLDDLGFDAERNQALVPAAQLEELWLIDAKTLATRRIGGFGGSSASEKRRGPTTVSVTPKELLVGDRDRHAVVVFDRETAVRKSAVPLAGTPDYVRFVGPAQVWATEPGAQRIEVLDWPASPDGGAGRFLAVPGGPEGLAIDQESARVYTNSEDRNELLVFDSHRPQQIATWATGCPADPRGLAIDPQRHWLFDACKGGRVSLIDSVSGKVLDQLQGEAGLDIIAFDAVRRRLYLPGGQEGKVVVASVSAEGKMRRLGELTSAVGAHCVASDGQGTIFVCDPRHGRILVLRDPY